MHGSEERRKPARSSGSGLSGFLRRRILFRLSANQVAKSTDSSHDQDHNKTHKTDRIRNHKVKNRLEGSYKPSQKLCSERSKRRNIRITVRSHKYNTHEADPLFILSYLPPRIALTILRRIGKTTIIAIVQ